MKTTFSHFEDAFIKAHYLEIPIKVIASILGRSFCGVKGRMIFFDLTIPADVLAMRKQASLFKPGQEAYNKGLKQSQFMTKEAIGRSKETRFKKGNEPHNTRSDGEITIRKDKSGIPYQYIRINKRNWQLLQRYNYQKAFGKIPEGYLITFIDRNTMNCHPDNLMAISMADNARRNSIHNYPPEIVKAIKTLSKLNKKIQNYGKEQN
jgi:hypothetical protein